jgi:hypothetical protein
MFRAYKKMFNRYISNNNDKIVNEGSILLPIARFTPILKVIIVALFLIGAYITYKHRRRQCFQKGLSV